MQQSCPPNVLSILMSLTMKKYIFTLNRDNANVAHYIEDKFQKLKDYPMVKVCYCVDNTVFTICFKHLGLTFAIQYEKT